MFLRLIQMAVLSGVVVGSGHLGLADDVDEQIAAIAAVGPQGRGSEGARRACNSVAQQGPDILPRLLAAMDTPNIVAANWYRAAYERIVARELASTTTHIPVEALKAYVRGPGHQGRARRLALDLVDRIEPAFKTALVPTLLDDPEFRDDAVAVRLQTGDEAKTRGDMAKAKRDYETAFSHARDAKQATDAAARLAAFGEKVSIVEHLGFVIEWFIIGPFPAAGMTGFDAVFPPETSIDLAASIETGDKKVVKWSRHRTDDPFGTVDLVRLLGPANEAVGYAYTELDSPLPHDVQLRCSADDCLAVWLDGQKVFGRSMWLNGTRLDRFITPVHLARGRNRILVKVCQGPHHRDPAVGNAWTFQLRFCSADGAGVALKPVLPTAIRATAQRGGAPQ